jgi:hypothetical protein
MVTGAIWDFAALPPRPDHDKTHQRSFLRRLDLRRTHNEKRWRFWVTQWGNGQLIPNRGVTKGEHAMVKTGGFMRMGVRQAGSCPRRIVHEDELARLLVGMGGQPRNKL